MPCLPDLPSAPSHFDAFVEALQQAMRVPMADVPDTVRGVLSRFPDKHTLLTAAQQTGAAESYTRHLLYDDPQGRFSVVSLVWLPGQRTPVHGHYAWCAYAIVQGAMQEDLFRWNATTCRADLTRRVLKQCGDTSAGHAGLDAIHRLSQIGDSPAISIHVYGVDGARVATHVNRIAACT